MKKIKLLVALVAVLTLLLVATSCNLSEDSERARELCTQMTDAILDNDFDAAYALVSEICTVTEFEETYSTLRDMLAGITSYELKQIGFHSQIKNGVSTYTATYRIQSDQGGDMAVEVSLTSGYEGLTKYVVQNDAPVDAVGGLTTMGQFNVAQWGLLIYSALCIALVVLMVIDCARRTLNAKALWIILIVIGHLKIYAQSVASEFSGGFRIGAFLPFSSFLTYANGNYDFTLFLPVGAIVYFFLRKRMTKNYQPPLPPADSEDLGDQPVDDE